MDIHTLYRFFSRRARAARMKAFLELHQPARGTTILDIGGAAEFWAGTDLNVTLLNIQEPSQVPSGLKYVQADATRIPYEDASFEIAFSNSMIEHLYTRDKQREAAREAMRVGEALWIQTPNRWFPIEPHYLTPFIHWFPASLRRRMVRNFTVWGLVTRPSREAAHELVDEIQLLSAKDLRQLFPGCRLLRERFLGLTKSLIVVRGARHVPSSAYGEQESPRRRSSTAPPKSIASGHPITDGRTNVVQARRLGSGQA